MGVTTLLLGLVALFLLLLLAGMAYQAIGSARDARRYPPPGRMVDVGGREGRLGVPAERGGPAKPGRESGQLPRSSHPATNNHRIPKADDQKQGPFLNRHALRNCED